MRILAIDQARHGAWAIFDYESKTLEFNGTWAYENRNYPFEKAVLQIETLINDIIENYGICAVFIEDIQLRCNVKAFKRLAQLQGVLINLCEKLQIPYWLIAPTTWQNYCKARGRTSKEIKAKITSIEQTGKKASKMLSLQAVKDIYGLETDNDNLADAVMIGHYAVNKIQIGGQIDEKKQNQ